MSTIILGFIGGLGLFLYGMSLMSDSLEKVAGEKLRGILETFTKNKYIGIIVGIIFTAIVQSSSATTVMVVSFVNAGLMNLFQAVGVIYGANIGTTVTSQLVSFNLSKYAPAFIMLGVLITMLGKKPTVKKTGEVVIGFGILFLGISTMSSSMSVLKELPAVQNMFMSLDNRLFALLLGLVITAIVQSSSVTVSILLLLAQQGLIPLPMALFAILGCNIGSCFSAMLASLNGKKMAKRAAMIHLSFNVIGSVVIAMILFLAPTFIENLILNMSNGDMGRSVANAHTMFKVFQVIILMPFMNQIVKLSYMLIPGEDNDKVAKDELKYIGEDYIPTPPTAVPQACREITRHGKLAVNNLKLALEALVEVDEEKAEKVFETEKIVDSLTEDITDFLIKANQMSLPVDDRKRIAGLLHVVGDIERIGDHAENIAEDVETVIKLGTKIDGPMLDEMNNMTEKTLRILNLAMDMFSAGTDVHLQEIIELENEIDTLERQYQRNHMDRTSKGECNVKLSALYSDLLSNMERVADHATNIAFSILEEDPEPVKQPTLFMDVDGM